MFHLTKIHASGVKVLDNAFFSAPSGSFSVIRGESRTGKSTLLKMLCGEEKPTSGTLLIDHKEIHKVSPAEKKEWLVEVGLILPDLKLFPDKTVEENILFPLRVKGGMLKEGKEAILRLLGSTGLKDKAQAKPGDLSSGEQQMVMALRAMVFRPKLLLADEPFQGLDEKVTEVLLRFLDQLNKEGTTIIFSTQQDGILLKMKDFLKQTAIEWVQLRDGKLLPLEGE
jgi:cell division transport system ATP-binding protein